MQLVCLPCEIQHREFDAKLLLAVRLSQKYGHPCLIGFDKYFTKVVETLGPVVLLEKSMSSIMLNARILPVKKNGGFVVVNDEEGINDLNETPLSFLTRVASNGWQYIDKYACWGEFDKAFYLKNSEAPEYKLKVLGNPRSDLLNELGKSFYKAESESISKIFGNFLLVSDNFSVNHFEKNYSPPRFNKLSQTVWENRKKEWDWQQKTHTIRRNELAKIIELTLEQYKGIHFLIRPHPVYDPMFWHEKFRLNRNVDIIYKFNADPWIHSSSGVISNGCTLGLQALLANKISLHHVFEEDEPSKSITSELSSHVKNPQDIIASKDLESKEKNNLNFYWMHQGSSTSRMADLLNHYTTKINSRVSNLNLPRLPELYPKSPKWVGSSLKDTSYKVKRWCQVLGCNEPRLVEVSPGVFLLSPK